jgi:hypothetical protein
LTSISLDVDLFSVIALGILIVFFCGMFGVYLADKGRWFW